MKKITLLVSFSLLLLSGCIVAYTTSTPEEQSSLLNRDTQIINGLSFRVVNETITNSTTYLNGIQKYKEVHFYVEIKNLGTNTVNYRFTMVELIDKDKNLYKIVNSFGGTYNDMAFHCRTIEPGKIQYEKARFEIELNESFEKNQLILNNIDFNCKSE